MIRSNVFLHPCFIDRDKEKHLQSRNKDQEIHLDSEMTLKSQHDDRGKKWDVVSSIQYNTEC